MASKTEAKKQEFSLNNPFKVDTIKDHGQSYYRQDYGPSRRTISEPVARGNGKSLIEKMQTELDNAKTGYYLASARSFIPCSDFYNIVNPERVLEIISNLTCFENRSKEEKQQLAQEIYFGIEGGPPSLKVFGILIGIDKIEDLDIHMKDGLRDDCLPMEATRDPGVFSLVCRRKNHEHRVLNNYHRSEIRENFANWTRMLLAPYITSRDGRHPHYVLDNGNCLPMEFQRKVSNPVDNGDAISRNGGSGGFSDVYKVKIYNGHYNLQSSRMRHPEGYFALKKLTSQSRESFNLELRSLLFAAEQKGVDKKHMIQLLATFEESNNDDNQSTFYLLFDWANGDLEEFWKKNKHFVRDMEHCLWMAEQFLGLANALKVVHNERQETLQSLPKGISDSRLYCRHGDIKPGNLLWFENGFALADFGLGRLHSKLTRSNQDPEFLAKTATYRAPEFDLPKTQGGRVGPTSDVYSLGCVFLEYISWFLLGEEGIRQFATEREERDTYGFEADEFFRITVSTPGGQQLAVVKPQVKDWIAKLKDHECCSKYLHQMLDLIQDRMLHPDPESRFRAPKLAKELTKFPLCCQSCNSFYTENWKTNNSPTDEESWVWLRWMKQVVLRSMESFLTAALSMYQYVRSAVLR